MMNKRKPHPFQKTERNQEIARLFRETELSLRRIAYRYDLSVERVRQIVRDDEMRRAGVASPSTKNLPQHG